MHFLAHNPAKLALSIRKEEAIYYISFEKEKKEKI